MPDLDDDELRATRKRNGVEDEIKNKYYQLNDKMKNNHCFTLNNEENEKHIPRID